MLTQIFNRNKDDVEENRRWVEDMTKIEMPKQLRNDFNLEGRVTIEGVDVVKTLIFMLKRNTSTKFSSFMPSRDSLADPYTYQDKFDILYRKNASLNVKLTHSKGSFVPINLIGANKIQEISIKDLTKTIFGIYRTNKKLNILLQYYDNSGKDLMAQRSYGIGNYNLKDFSKEFQEYIKENSKEIEKVSLIRNAE